ncbi:MAG: PAS domain S-box protein, partial [Myxococcota bacterium]
MKPGLNGGQGRTGLFRKARYVDDITLDPRWNELREAALALGIDAAWSHPIVGAMGDVLGTFAIGSSFRRQPAAWEISVLETASSLAAISLQQMHHLQQLQTQVQKRQQAQDRFQALVEALEDVFWSMDPAAGWLTYASPSFERLYGLPAEVCLSDRKRWFKLVPPDDRKTLRQLSQSIAQGTFNFERPVEHRILRPDGAERWISHRVYPIYRDGRLVEVFGVSSDITEQRRAQALQDSLQQRINANQRLEALGRLASGITHDFNNIITVIHSYAAVMAERLLPDHPLREDVAAIIDAADRATRLTQQLLTFSHSHHQPHHLEPISPGRVLNGMRPMLKRITGHDIQLVINDNNTGDVLAALSQFEQIILNLVFNARDAMPNGGTLQIETHQLWLEPE